MDYLNILQDASLLADASMADKLIACLIVTVLGMGITFAALLILWVSISTMSHLLNPKKKEAAVEVKKVEPVQAPSEPAVEEEANSEELIAVIAAAVAASLNTSIITLLFECRSCIRWITAWNSAGRQEQMNTRFSKADDWKNRRLEDW